MKPAQLAALTRNQQRMTAWFPTFAAMQTGNDPQSHLPARAAMPPSAVPTVPTAPPMVVAREHNPAPSISYVDLDALVIVNAEDPSLNGAELVDVVPTDDNDLVTATYKNPSNGSAVTEILPVLRDTPDTPWWQREGHCCESCALGHECDGEECSLERSSNPMRSRATNPIVHRRRSGIFSRR